MRKIFPCGHTGKGQYCHRCDQKSREMAARVAARHEKLIKIAQYENELGMELKGIPEMVMEKAASIAKGIRAGASYMDYHGKRMTDNREIVSVPIGWSYRLVMRDCNGDLKSLMVLSHEEYNCEPWK